MLHDITDPTEVTVTPVFAVKIVEPDGYTYIMVDGKYYGKFDHVLEHDEHVSDDIVQAVETYRKKAFDTVADKIVATAPAANLGNLPCGEGGTLDTDTVRYEPVLTPRTGCAPILYGVEEASLDAMGHIAKARIAANIARDHYGKAMAALPQGAVAALNAELEELGAQVKEQYATFI